MKLAPIVIYTYNRPRHLLRTLNSLKKNDLSIKSDIYFFCDGPKNKNKSELKKINTIKKIIRNLKGFKKINFTFNKKNIGLKKNILNGITQILKKNKDVIVLEDDIIVSKFFLEYMNQSLNFYKNKKKVWHVSGWNYNLKLKNIKQKDENTFFIKNMNCWGWATWSDRWKKIIIDPDFIIKKMNNKKIHDFNLSNVLNNWSQLIRNKEKQLDTWAIFWNATIFLNNGLCLNPTISMTKNIGLDGSGVNSSVEPLDKKEFSKSNSFLFSKKIKENINLRNEIIRHMKIKNKKNRLKDLKNKFLSTFGVCK